MKLKLIITLIAVSTLVVFIIVYSMSSYLKPTVAPSPSPTVTPSHTPYPYIKTPPTYFTDLSQWQVNVTQGESFQINVTITSFLNKTITFTPEVQLAGYGNAAWDSSKDSHKVYNATFNQEQLVLEPNVKVSTILTFNIAQDAPLGRYLFYVTNDGLEVIVGPKPNCP
jgi:hypothetical protein